MKKSVKTTSAILSLSKRFRHCSTSASVIWWGTRLSGNEVFVCLKKEPACIVLPSRGQPVSKRKIAERDHKVSGYLNRFRFHRYAWQFRLRTTLT